MNEKITRRQALLSLAGITAGTVFTKRTLFCAQPLKTMVRFPVVGDFGTGGKDQVHIAQQMFEAHQRAAFDFVIAAGDNIYPNGSGRYFGKHFEQPFAPLLKERVRFHAVLGNHDVREGRQDQCQYPLFNMCLTWVDETITPSSKAKDCWNFSCSTRPTVMRPSSVGLNSN